MQTNPGRVVAILALAASAAAQVEWRERTVSPDSRWAHAIAYEPSRDTVLLFGGAAQSFGKGDTWLRRGGVWARIHTEVAPSPRSGIAMAHDAGRGVTVLFGGSTGVPLAETWEWNGSGWSQRMPQTSPPPRRTHAMAYDSGRGRLVMFGGVGSTTLGDTWEWDGTDWTLRNPTGAPPPRAGHAMAYDRARGRVVLFGGVSALGDTWEYDGTSWTQRAAGGLAPPGRYGHSMEYDGATGRVVLFGGLIGGTTLASDTWEWDGTTWARRDPDDSPPARSHVGMTYDGQRRRVVLFGGQTSTFLNQTSQDTWEWDGTSWTDVTPPAPSARSYAALAFDRRRAEVLLFGGISSSTEGDTWKWDGSAWTLLSPVNFPTPRYGAGAAYDSARDRVVLFGGRGPFSTLFAETWEWDGSVWRQRNPAVSPPARSLGATMTYDSARGRTVLFGGFDGTSTRLADTWEWDGTSWLQRTPANSPPPSSYNTALSYDTLRQVAVLQGQGTTWEWNGTDWRQREVLGPPAYTGSFHAYDEARGRTVLFGGFGASDDTWEWDGTTWTRRSPSVRPPRRHGAPMVYDAARAKVLVFGGRSGSNQVADLWEYGPVHPASYSAFGQGCAGSAGTPSLAVRLGGLPWRGASFAQRVTLLPPGGATVGVLGGSRTTWFGGALPLALGRFGMAGCSLYVSPDVLLPLSNQGGTALWSMPIPPSTSPLGAELYTQAYVLDAGANAAGVAWSNAAAATIGSR